MADITPRELLALLRTIENRGLYETAGRLRGFCGAVFRFAIATGRAERDPSMDLRGALTTPIVSHRASIVDPAAIGALLRAIDGFAGQPTTHAALRLAAYTFARPGELRRAEWAEFDLDAAVWSIPAKKMKMRRPHRVPLARQSLAILHHLQALTGGGRWLFPSIRTTARPISENTLNAGLRRLGYSSEEMTTTVSAQWRQLGSMKWGVGTPMPSSANSRTRSRTPSVERTRTPRNFGRSVWR